MQELAYRVEKRFKFTGKEIRYLLVTVVVAAFVLNFRSWGGDEFSFGEGMTNLIITGVVVFISFLIHFAAQKVVALSMGYVSKYKYWLNGILISLIVTFFTYGYFPLFFTGSLWHDTVTKLRVGEFRGGPKHKEIGYIAFAGPLANILIVCLVAPLYLATEGAFFHTIFVANLLIAVFSLLPIPTFEKIRQFKGGTTGLYLFIASRWLYVLIFLTVLLFTALILVFKLYSIILALVIAALITVVYYTQYEVNP